MQTYLDLLKRILEEGEPREDRTGTGTLGVFGAQLRFDLRKGFPLLTTKKVHLKSIVHELLWFIRGETRSQSLNDVGVTIWDEWATADATARFGREAGDLGPVYGHQWRNFGATATASGAYEKDGFDQLAHLVEQLKENPWSRRHIVTGWNPKEADQVALPPCHTLFQFHVQGNALRCQLYQRSADVFLGVPFNIASYALLTHMVAQATNLEAREFIHTFGDVHLYANHVEQARTQLSRAPRALPRLRLNPSVRDLFAFKFEDISVEEYDPHPAIPARVAV